MIVCLCKGVSSHRILDEARRGNRSVTAIAEACQAGTGCGACVNQIKQLVEGTQHGRDQAVRLRRTS